MKRCENCFETNSDGATHCVICAEPIGLDETETETAAHKPQEQAVLVDTEDTDTGAIDDGPSHWLDEEDLDAEAASCEATSCGEEDAGRLESASNDALKHSDSDFKAKNDDEPEYDCAAVEAVTDTRATTTTVVTAKPALATTTTTTSRRAALQVFHDNEGRVVHTHPVVNDITLIGREDPQRDIFPDLDLGRLSSQGVSASHVSRQHLRLLRQAGKYFLFVYRGTTGTQVNKEIVDESRYAKRFEVRVGDRIVLGGKVRLKLAPLE